jgi:hypothetical protein
LQILDFGFKYQDNSNRWRMVGFNSQRDFQIKKCPKTDAEILSLCTLCLCGSFLRIIYFLEVSKRLSSAGILGIIHNPMIPKFSDNDTQFYIRARQY